MRTPLIPVCTAAFAAAALFPSPTAAQQPGEAATFAAPVRLKAGDKLLGERRLFPSPVYHDVDGDGLVDILVGDLIGKITVALRLPGDGPPRYAAETPLEAEDGKPIDFHNW